MCYLLNQLTGGGWGIVVFWFDSGFDESTEELIFSLSFWQCCYCGYVAAGQGDPSSVFLFIIVILIKLIKINY